MSFESSIRADSTDRQARIEAIVDDVLHRRQAGENVPDEELLGANRELMPELGNALRGVALVQEAWLRADHSQVSADESAAHEVRRGPIELAGLAPPGYDLLELIHRGGQGVVYRAVQKSTRRVVAFKIMHEGPLTSREDKVRFDREVRVLAQLRHPNIVAIHDSGEWAGAFYLVMDFVEGRSLDEWWRQEAEAREQEKRPSRLRDAGSRSGDALRVFLKICDAVNAAHLLGIIHRDLKPSNIRVDAAGEPFVLDFGLAKLTGDSRVGTESLAEVTQTGQFVGSLPWASPEQVTVGDSSAGLAGPSATLDMRTDVYSLGVMLYQLLTGRFPYDVTGPMRDVIDRIVNAEPSRPSAGPGDPKGSARSISSDLETIVLKCLAKERDRRYQNAGELSRNAERIIRSGSRKAVYNGGKPVSGASNPMKDSAALFSSRSQAISGRRARRGQARQHFVRHAQAARPPSHRCWSRRHHCGAAGDLFSRRVVALSQGRTRGTRRRDGPQRNDGTALAILPAPGPCQAPDHRGLPPIRHLGGVAEGRGHSPKPGASQRGRNGHVAG